MSPNPLFKLREWLTVDEARQLLSQMIDEPVAKADVLRLGLDGHLKLSVFLPQGTIANCWNLEEDTPPRDVENGAGSVEEEIHHDDVQDSHDPTGLGVIDGVWDLPMVSPGSLQVAKWFNELHQLPQIPLDGLTGAVVERPGTHCRLRAEGKAYSSPASVLPAGSQIVVRTAEIVKFASTLLEPNPLNKPLTDSERTTLLIIIGAVAQKGPIDISEPYGAGKKIAVVTGTMGVAVSEKTIGNYLKLVKKAVADRSL